MTPRPDVWYTSTYDERLHPLKNAEDQINAGLVNFLSVLKTERGIDSIEVTMIHKMIAGLMTQLNLSTAHRVRMKELNQYDNC